MPVPENSGVSQYSDDVGSNALLEKNEPMWYVGMVMWPLRTRHCGFCVVDILGGFRMPLLNWAVEPRTCRQVIVPGVFVRSAEDEHGNFSFGEDLFGRG